jgi:hypothetical protein
MSKYVFLQPREVTTGDTVGYMNVIATDKNGYVDIINTGSTINTLSPDKNIVIGDVVTRPGDYKQVPGNLHVDGDIIIASAGDITIGAETIKHEAFLTVEGYINCTGTIDIQGTFFPGYAKAEVGPAGTSGSSGSDGSAGQMGSTGTSGISGTSGESGSSGSSGESGSSGTSGTTATTGTSGTGGTAGTGIPMASMVAWYKADAGITSVGSHITQWDDQSGNAHHLYSSGDNRPRYGDIQLNSINVPNTVTGWASDSPRKMVTTTQLPDVGPTGTVFIVGAQYVGEGFYNYFLDTNNLDGILVARNSGNQEIAGSIDNSNNPPYVSVAAATDATFYTIRLTGDGTNSKVVLNNTVVGTDFPQSGGPTSAVLTIFNGTNSGRSGKKSIAEIIIYSDLLSNLDILAVESYLRTKWGHY